MRESTRVPHSRAFLPRTLSQVRPARRRRRAQAAPPAHGGPGPRPCAGRRRRTGEVAAGRCDGGRFSSFKRHHAPGREPAQFHSPQPGPHSSARPTPPDARPISSFLSSPPLRPANPRPGVQRADLFLPPTPTFGCLRMTSGAEHCGPVRDGEEGRKKKKAKH